MNGIDYYDITPRSERTLNKKCIFIKKLIQLQNNVRLKLENFIAAQNAQVNCLYALSQAINQYNAIDESVIQSIFKEESSSEFLLTKSSINLIKNCIDSSMNDAQNLALKYQQVLSEFPMGRAEYDLSKLSGLYTKYTNSRETSSDWLDKHQNQSFSDLENMALNLQLVQDYADSKQQEHINGVGLFNHLAIFQQKYRPSLVLPLVETLLQLPDFSAQCAMANVQNGESSREAGDGTATLKNGENRSETLNENVDLNNSFQDGETCATPYLKNKSTLLELKTGAQKTFEEAKNFEVAHSTQLSELIQIDNSHHSYVNLESSSGWLHIFEDRKINLQIDTNINKNSTDPSDRAVPNQAAKNFLTGLETLTGNIMPKIWKRYHCYVKDNFLYKSWAGSASESVKVEPVCSMFDISRIERLHGSRNNKIRAWTMNIFISSKQETLQLQAESEDDLDSWIKLLGQHLKNSDQGQPGSGAPAGINVIYQSNQGSGSERRGSETESNSSTGFQNMTKNMKESFTSENLFSSFSSFKNKIDEGVKNTQSALDNLPDITRRASQGQIQVIGEKFTARLVKHVRNVKITGNDLQNAPKSFEVACDFQINDIFGGGSASSSSISGLGGSGGPRLLGNFKLFDCHVGSDALGLQNYQNISFGDILFVGEFNKVNNDPFLNCVTILHKRLEAPNKLKEAASEISRGFSKFTSLIKKENLSSLSEEGNGGSQSSTSESSGPQPILVYDILIMAMEDNKTNFTNGQNGAVDANSEGLQPEHSFYQKLAEMRRNYQIAVDTQSNQSSNEIFHH